jgi:hypothetical protein
MLSTYYCDQPLLAAIGSIAAESAYLERFIESMLYRLTKLSREVGRPLVEKGMLDAKLTALQEVSRAKLKRRPKRMKRLDSIISRLRTSNTDRGIAIHGVWIHEVTWAPGLIGMPTFGPPRASKRKGTHPDATMRAERAMKLATEIYDGHKELHDFAKETWPLLFPPPVPLSGQPPLPHQP